MPEAVTHRLVSAGLLPQSLSERLAASRRRSIDIARPLSPEDMTVQAMDDASPTKWHLAHTTWFYETFVLGPHMPGYRRFDDSFAYCFNSYYEGAGPRHPRTRRGLLTRPSSAAVMDYRAHVDASLATLLHDVPPDPTIHQLVELGINHEQQHQELMLTDILALLACNPLAPAYRELPEVVVDEPASTVQWLSHPGGIRSIGNDGEGFCWDNETPRHSVLLQPYRLADRLVTNAEWLEFIADGGYRNPLLWLSDGWATVKNEGWIAPLYWELRDDVWQQFTLAGLQPVPKSAPVSHISYFEADAFARWTGKRLPTEFEWEFAVAADGGDPPASDDVQIRPAPLEQVARSEKRRLHQAFGAVWQWTASAYLPYPGYRPPEGTIGEYNGKFMVSQHVLRGSSCVTPAGHARLTYRNFFYPAQRWQFTGVRLAADAGA
ncbi:MAG: ergothioneine biosynthesis protein EgtB [Hyphomicrobiaceae bacterium]